MRKINENMKKEKNENKTGNTLKMRANTKGKRANNLFEVGVLFVVEIQKALKGVLRQGQIHKKKKEQTGGERKGKS